MDNPPPPTNSPARDREDPTANCWLCDLAYEPTRVNCPQCKGFVVPTMIAGDQPIIWTLAIFEASATDAEWEAVVANAREISTTQHNIAICGTSWETSERTILVRRGNNWGLSFRMPWYEGENTITRHITTEKLDRFSTVVGLTTTGRGRLGLPCTKRRLQANLPQRLDGSDRRGCARR
jgi:hypothetical protein